MAISQRDELELFIDGHISEIRDLMLTRDDDSLTLEFCSSLIRLAWAYGLASARDEGLEELTTQLIALGFGMDS